MDLQLRRLRDEAGLSQTQLAEMIGASLKTVGNWERGKTAITLEDAYNCAVALGCTPNDICGWPEGRNEDRAFDDPWELELVECYRASPGPGRATIMDVARMAKSDAAERGAVQAEGVA